MGQLLRLAIASAGATALSACGGGGGGGLSFIPAPPAAPAPPQTAPTVGALAVPPDMVTATTDFATAGDDVSIRWNADLKAYELSVPGTGSGRVQQTFFATYGAGGDLVGSNGAKLAAVSATAPYRYSGLFEVYRVGDYDKFTAFGAATPAGGVPTVGSATYNAELKGLAGGWLLYGTAQFQFDFAGGKLSGYMDPHTNGPFESPALPRYTFSQTVFSPASTTFSGSFDIAGPTPSSFQGQFTGPKAEELIASFRAPFLDWDAQENPTVWNEMHGVMIGKHQ